MKTKTKFIIRVTELISFILIIQFCMSWLKGVTKKPSYGYHLLSLPQSRIFPDLALPSCIPWDLTPIIMALLFLPLFHLICHQVLKIIPKSPQLVWLSSVFSNWQMFLLGSWWWGNKMSSHPYGGRMAQPTNPGEITCVINAWQMFQPHQYPIQKSFFTLLQEVSL